MRKATNLYLPYADWPEDDRTRWEATFKAGVDRFDDCGPAAHLAEPTRLTLLEAYARFLAFISAHDIGLLARSPAARIDRKIVESYVRWQPASCGGVTIAANLSNLRIILRFICPGEDWSWMSTIANRIAALAKRNPEKHHLVTSETLYALGIELMDRAVTKANASENISIACALGYRDGLMIALLALIPLRRRTLAALRIGRQLVRSGDQWALDIPARDIKTKRPLEYPISAELSGRIDLYLNQFRCRIPRAGAHDYLWASKDGGPMRDKTIYATVRRRTREALGFPVNPHRFRRAAATLWSNRDPANVRGVKDLLGHASFGTTEKHYIMAQSRVAGRALARAIESERKGGTVRRTLRLARSTRRTN
jgi:integrase/recombinase XerD